MQFTKLKRVKKPSPEAAGTFGQCSHVAFDDFFVWAGLGRRFCHVPL